MLKCNFFFFFSSTLTADAVKLQFVYMHAFPTFVGVKRVTNLTFVSPSTLKLLFGRMQSARERMMLIHGLLLLLS
jgi:hypothetical protein